MTAIQRQRVIITSGFGGSGVATYFFLNAASAQTALTDLWQNLVAHMPADVTALVEPNGDTIEDSTGQLVASWTGAVNLLKTGAGGTYAAPAGCVIDWLTPIISDGHRVRGRTFVVPLGMGSYQSNGTLDDTVRTDLLTRASDFVTSTAGNFVIWHRPRAARAAIGTLKALPAHIGSHAVVTASAVPDKVAILRSRRD